MISSLFAVAQAPQIDNDFIKILQKGDEKVYSIEGVDHNKSLQENIVYLFYPDITGNRAILRRYVRTIGVWLLVIFLIRNGMMLLVNVSDDAKASGHFKNIWLALLGAVIYFGAVWILWSALNITNTGQAIDFVERIQSKFLLQVLIFLKVAAFFVAIIALVWAWFNMMGAMDKEDKVKAAKTGILNVIIALVFIKIVDFIYFIAQEPDFTSQLWDIIIKTATIMWRIIGAILLISIIYAWYLFIIDAGSWENAKKGKNLIINVFVIGLIIFLFLLIIYQLVAQFG